VTYQAAVAEYTRRGRLEGELQGKQHEAQALVLRQLPRRCGQLSQSQELAVRALSLEQLESLAEALLDFDGPEALDAWLAGKLAV
jgi:predicted transposase YdaD